MPKINGGGACATTHEEFAAAFGPPPTPPQPEPQAREFPEEFTRDANGIIVDTLKLEAGD